MWKCFLLIMLMPLSAGAAGVPHDPRQCDQRQEPVAKVANDVLISTCIKTCTAISKITTPQANDFYQTNCKLFYDNQAREKTIWDLFQTGGKIVDQWAQCMVGGAYKAVTGIPFLVYDLITAERKNESNTGFQDPNQQLETCFHDKVCRREMARNTLEMLDQSDAAIDQRLAGLSLEELQQRIQDSREIVADTCRTRYSDMQTKLLNDAGSWSIDLEKKFYSMFSGKFPTCAAVMNLKPPKTFSECVKQSPNAYAECLNTVEKIAVGVVCAGPEFSKRLDELTVDFCSDVVSVLAPVPLLGPQTSWTKAGAAAAAGATKEAAQIIKSELDNEAAALTQQWDYFAKETVGDRVAFTNAYKEKIFATADDNAHFIALTDDPAKLALENKTRIFDSENSVMKTLNDLTRDKNLVTSLTNKQKEILLKNLQALKTKYPGMQFDVYSDFKSVKIAIRNGEKFSPELSDQLLADLNAMYAKTNEEFAAEMARLGIEVPPAGDADTWMRAGYGRNVDEAALAARRARSQTGDANAVMDFYSPQVREAMTERLTEVESLRAALAKDPSFAPLFQKSAGGVSLPKQEVFDMVRKSKTNEELAAAIRQRFGVTDFTTEDAILLRGYAKGVDEFSPTLLIGKRENVNLDAAINGAASADFLGMGSANMLATAEGIAGKTDLVLALRGARQGEVNVTKTFKQRMETFRSIVGGTVTCSGDDCVRIAATAMTNTDKQVMLNRLASNSDTRAIRMAFVGEGVPQQFRMQLATQGEAIEKQLRLELARAGFPAELSSKMTFGIDMQTVAVNQGTVNLIVGKSGSLALNQAQRLQLQTSFRDALNYINRRTTAYVEGTTQMTDQTLFFVPGTGLPNVFNEQGH